MPLKDTPINPIDSSNVNDPYAQERNSIPGMPNLTVDISSIDPLAFKDNPGTTSIPNPQPFSLPKPNTIGKPGFISTFAHAVGEYSELLNAGKFIYQEADQLSHLSDPVPENFEVTYEDVKEFPDKYWPNLIGSASPKDLEARKSALKDRMADEEYYSRGSFVANLLGGIVGGGALSPSTWLLPMSAGVKYANFTQNLLRNTIKAAPNLVATTLATEGLHEAAIAGGNMQDFAVNSFRDLAWGTALIGGAAGLGHAMRGGQLWNVRKSSSYTFEGINFNNAIDDKGEYKGIIASAAPGMSVSADKVKLAQSFADSTMSKTGLFAIPYVDKLAGNSFLGSTIIRMLSSPYITTRGFIDKIASHGIITQGIERGIARGDSAEDLINITRAKSTQFSAELKGLFYEANGLTRKVNATNAAKNFKQVISSEQRIKWNDFGKQVRNVIYSGEDSLNPQVNEAAQKTMAFVKSIGDEFRKAHGWSDDWLPPRTAVNYLMQNYNIEEIIKRPQEFINLVASAYKEQDEIISRLNRPIDELETKISGLKEAIRNPQFKETRALANELKSAQAQLRNAKDKLITEIQDNHDYHILLEDRVMLNSKESDELAKIKQPLQEHKDNLNKLNEKISSLKTSRSKINSLINKNVTDKAKSNNLLKLEKIEQEIKSHELKLKEIEDNIFKEEGLLEERIASGEINRKFYTYEKDTAKPILRNPHERPKLRKVFESDSARLSHAFALSEKIRGNSPDQLNQQILGQMFPGAVDNPNYTLARSVMIPSKVFNDANFLEHDIGKSVTSYASTMGKSTALKKSFGSNVSAPGIDGIIKSLNEEKRAKENAIKSKEGTKEGDKERLKHEKEYQKAVSDIKKVYDIFMGRGRGSPKQRAAAAALRNLAAITKLGGVPIAQLTDLGAIVLKQNVYPFMMQGLRPMLKTMNGRIGGRDSEVLKKNAAHAHVAIQTLQSGYHSKFIEGDMMSTAPLAGRIGSSLDNLAHMSGNFFGTNFIENANQTMVANITQSKIIAALHDFKSGKITKDQHIYLSTLGIDPNHWADRMISNYKRANGWEEFGGYQSKYWDWDDAEAVERMSNSIHRSVYNTVVQRGMFTSPLWANDPILGLLFTFHGWAYGAFARYTVPAMQRPNAEVAMGMAFMFGFGLMTEPLRQWANGQEVNLDDDYFFAKGFLNSGIGGPLPDVINYLNLVTHNNLIPGLVNERTRNLSVIGAMAGPIGGMAEDAFSLLEHLWRGNISQVDLKKAARLFGLSSHLLSRNIWNDIIKDSGLPEKPSQAESWPWWQSATGVK